MLGAILGKQFAPSAYYFLETSRGANLSQNTPLLDRISGMLGMAFSRSGEGIISPADGAGDYVPHAPATSSRQSSKGEPEIKPEFHQQIKQATQSCHEYVDAAFGVFDLSKLDSYADFLVAHAQALIPLEKWLDLPEIFAPAHPRSHALVADLDELGRQLAAGPTPPWPRTDAARWGAAYVVEGSRLGGSMLLRQVPAHFPRAYLGSSHPAGAWRGFLAAMNDKARGSSAIWRSEAMSSAKDTFALYEAAARSPGDHVGQ